MFMLNRKIYPLFTTIFRRFSKSFCLNLEPVVHEPFLNGVSCTYIEELYKSWKNNPTSVHISWQTFFKSVENNAQPGYAYQSPVAGKLVGKQIKVTQDQTKTATTVQTKIQPVTVPTTSPVVTPGKNYGNINDHLAVFSVINSYRNRGHLQADLDPLNIHRGPSVKKRSDTEDSLILGNHKLPTDLSVTYKLPQNIFLGGDKTELTLKEIIDRLNKVYCNKIGVEIEQMIKDEEAIFLNKRLESPNEKHSLSNEEKKLVLNRLCFAHNFEFFLSKKWPAEKRFGLEGSDVYIPAMRHMMEVGSNHGAEYFIIGMAHRGRLNTLVNVLELPLILMFAQFQPLDPDNMYGQGDVKYHTGSTRVVTHAFTKKQIRVSLCANPSHLESINPVVIGKAVADQLFLGDKNQIKVWPVIVHGDAAICGQGVVYETFHLSELRSYNAGGTIHIVINNQIGFTTDPYLSRSSEYCTAVAKVVDAPIFHVNGDDVESVMHVIHVAVDYRAKFKKDVVIDLVGYRKFGHNEVDEPMFTQPAMYKVIKQMKPLYHKYKEELIASKVVTEVEVNKVEKDYQNKLEAAFHAAKKVIKLDPKDWLSSPWHKFFTPDNDPLLVPVTGVKVDILDRIGKAISVPPPNFKVHRSIQRIFNNRKSMLEAKKVDWATGESFALSSLLQEGIIVRLSGQDVERGTFSHRHHVLHDQDNGNMINILHNIFPNQAQYFLCNSSLSEFGVLGFEFGISLGNPNSLVMWEAQFGDFSNSAQVIFDQYLSSGQEKWFRHAGIVCLLPHGLEGQGPEHSSARPERYLQLCNDDDTELNMHMPQQLKDANWILVNPTTPANFFHVLRRHIKLNYRKPLIIFSPKSLLRLPDCISPLEDLTEGTQFRPYLPDPEVPPSEKVKKLLLCSGKVYYDLREARGELKGEIAIGRIEQLSPLPYSDILKEATQNYPNARLLWVQEEHKNQGGWSYISPRLNKMLGKEKGPLTYIGRLPSASPATGHKVIYVKEKEQFLFAAMNL